VARDRQRAKQRRQRRAAQNPGPAPTEPHRENVPGELDHLSGEVEQVEAAIIAGAQGEPFNELDDGDADDAGLERAALAAGPSAAAVPGQPTPRGRNRVFAFLRASWAELQRVQWPDRRQVAQATAVVLGFVLVAGAYLGLADALAQRIVDFIL
jgi:preprotein translocase subunit SecE